VFLLLILKMQFMKENYLKLKKINKIMIISY
jgi:hypothetical protein